MKKHVFIGFLIVFGAMNTSAQISYDGWMGAAIKFFDANRCGPKAGEGNAFSWRGACHVNDKVTGGYHDAGDHVKFGLPQCWSAATLAWAYYEYPASFAPVKAEFFRMLKYFTDYFLACHTAPDVFYYGFGDGGADHGYWGPPESQGGSRPARSNAGSDVLAQASAALTLMSLIYKSEDAAYATKCLNTAVQLYDLALKRADSKGRSDDGGGGKFYKSSSHYDDMCWGAIWLYTATGKSSYLDPIEEWTKIPNDPGDDHYKKRWSPAWDDVILFVLLKMAEITGKQSYYDGLVWNLEWCRDVCKKSPAGLPIIDMWGPLRYASLEAGQGFTAYKLLGYDGFKNKADFIIDYILGKNPENRSYLTNWGRNPPVHPHHRANEPSKGGGTKGIIGALVGGPTNDKHNDDVGDFFASEVAIDYNASFIYGLAGYIFFKEGGKPKNRAPSVSITSPLNGVALPVNATINIKVAADDADGKVTKLDLYKGEELLKSSPTSPITHVWQSSGADPITLKAIATDDSGNVSNPTTVTVQFVPPCTPGSMMNRLGWRATASHTSQNAPEAPGSALDGKPDTRWGSGAGQSPGMWFQVDMGFPRSFDKIVLNATGSGGDFPKSYKAYATNDTANLGSPIAEGAGAEVTTIALSETKAAQYIRVVCGEGDGRWWSIHEVDVQCAPTGIKGLPHMGRNKMSLWIDAPAQMVNYQLPERGKITIEEYALSGSRLRVLVDDFQEAGNHQFAYTANRLGSKLALLKVNYNGHTQVKKVIFFK